MAQGVVERTRGKGVFGDLAIEDRETGELVGLVIAKQVVFTEADGSAAGVYTGAVKIPAGATVIDVKIRSTALWDAASDALMIVGDTDTDNGFYTSLSVKSIDLVVDEELNFENQGGKIGAFLVTGTGHRKSHYTAAAKEIIGKITTTGAVGTLGVTIMTVIYIDPNPAGIKPAIFAVT